MKQVFFGFDSGRNPSTKLKYLEDWLPGLVSSYMGVSKNRGTPKSSILIKFSIINHPFWGYHYFWKHPYSNSLTFISYEPWNIGHLGRGNNTLPPGLWGLQKIPWSCAHYRTESLPARWKGRFLSKKKIPGLEGENT